MLHKYSEEKQSLQLNLGDSESNVKIFKWFPSKYLNNAEPMNWEIFFSTVVA